MNQTTIPPDQRDILAEVLKDLMKKKPISKERAEAALTQHNKVRVVIDQR